MTGVGVNEKAVIASVAEQSRVPRYALGSFATLAMTEGKLAAPSAPLREPYSRAASA